MPILYIIKNPRKKNIGSNTVPMKTIVGTNQHKGEHNPQHESANNIKRVFMATYFIIYSPKPISIL